MHIYYIWETMDNNQPMSGQTSAHIRTAVFFQAQEDCQAKESNPTWLWENSLPDPAVVLQELAVVMRLSFASSMSASSK